MAIWELGQSISKQRNDVLLRTLHYPLGVFVNIDSAETQARHYSGPMKDRINFFAVQKRGARSEIRHAHYSGDELIERFDETGESGA